MSGSVQESYGTYNYRALGTPLPAYASRVQYGLPVSPAVQRSSGATGSLTLDRGLRALRVLSENPGGFSVSQLASALGTHRAGVYRLLGPLLEQRLVARSPEGLYSLGVGLIELASGVRPRLQAVALPELQRLADALGATTALTLLDGEEAVVIAVVEPRNTDMHIAYRAGLRHALDQAASGIAILASLPPKPGERGAITETRRRGWALSRGELIPGATGVAAALALSDPTLHASISAVWIELRDAEDVAALVVESSRVIVASLG
jgi:DNA-binding IclR family transcriptional regulator